MKFYMIFQVKGKTLKHTLLQSFLNAVMENEDKIVSVKIQGTDIGKEHIEDKYSRLDIKATTNRNEKVNIEIQVKNEYNMIKRSLYYWSKMYEEDLKEGLEKGEDRGIELTKKVFKLSNSGESIEEIAKVCDVSIDKINKILE
ncbi:MAG: Rpn family recombination-promoting nuclease/putative transposase [Clostridium sp.]